MKTFGEHGVWNLNLNFPSDNHLVEKDSSEFCQSKKYHCEKNYETLWIWSPGRVYFK